MRFLFVGRLIERKGIDILLDAFRAVEGGEL
jgi:glycosyltransferase involved in cell wall biosynthesis